MKAIIAITVCALCLMAWALSCFVRRARRRRLFSQSMEAGWIEILEAHVPLYGRLSESLQAELRGHINIFIDEKEFIGCGGLEISDEIRVVIAAQACFLLLSRETQYYPKLQSILVYPGAYVARERGRSGYTETSKESVRLGESWGHGTVVLAWDHSKHGAADINDGRNVVFHEFAHQLDQADGEADGTPILDGHTHYMSWARVLTPEFRKLQKKAKTRRKTVLDHYGATEPAEFFAVLTEAFFEKPRQLSKKHPELYEEVKSFYNVDPLEWRGSTDDRQ